MTRLTVTRGPATLTVDSSASGDTGGAVPPVTNQQLGTFIADVLDLVDATWPPSSSGSSSTTSSSSSSSPVPAVSDALAASKVVHAKK